MPSTKKIGVSDVAKHAGVSIGTVSNYLNYPERVSDTLKAKISASIAELGYVPRRAMPVSAASSALATPLIGYVMTDIEHSLFTSIFEGIQEVCEDNGMQVIATNAFSDLDRQHELVRLFAQMPDVAGIMLATVQDPREDIAIADAAGKPIILLDHTSPAGENAVCSVQENNVACGRLAAEELIRTGCRRLAFVAHSFDYESIQDRYLGMQQAVMRSSADVTLTIIDSGGLAVEDGMEIGRRLADAHAEQASTSHGEDGDLPPDGIVAGGDQLAMGLTLGLTDGGLCSIPGDVSVIGTENSRLEAIGNTPLTVVSAPGADMGRKAMMTMLDEINNPTHIHGSTLLDPTMVRRASTRR
ncbi:LacI family DNA-binding transcriptional regulator [Bifidobacterium eulemuris]|uniref:LacI family DNA-binding transcriptional regulator n=1 Tax=Bifidobacterium eulemuris TaxID=1765219 RepID=A0A261G0T3_9BIFI|nr:LacI family DNA-binding transcriptional regulator [Bifidobacterium eulemuris]OZG65031.1 sugar-binding protein [Bifidobacterium eulemuris]QOL32850.1 LacI family DNA-binding transcriptional regulator [Bifidobacterium eulemuris]